MFDLLAALPTRRGGHNRGIVRRREMEKVGKFPVTKIISSVQLLSRVRLFATPWAVARQASLSITNSCSLLKLMSIELVMPSNHLILCHPLLLPPSIFPSIRVFSNGSALRTRWSIGVSASTFTNGWHLPNWNRTFSYALWPTQSLLSTPRES